MNVLKKNLANAFPGDDTLISVLTKLPVLLIFYYPFSALIIIG